MLVLDFIHFQKLWPLFSARIMVLGRLEIAIYAIQSSTIWTVLPVLFKFWYVVTDDKRRLSGFNYSNATFAVKELWNWIDSNSRHILMTGQSCLKTPFKNRKLLSVNFPAHLLVFLSWFVASLSTYQILTSMYYCHMKTIMLEIINVHITPFRKNKMRLYCGKGFMVHLLDFSIDYLKYPYQCISVWFCIFLHTYQV